MISAGASQTFMPCYIYVDGQYVREEFRGDNRPDQFDPTKPAAFVERLRIGGLQLAPVRIFYYDAIKEGAPDEDAQRTYFKRVGKLANTHVIPGRVRKGTKTHEQKGVDVQLTVDALQAASRGVVQAIALVSGDSDFVPLAKAVRDAGPHFIVLAFKASLSPDLADAADQVIYLPDDPLPARDWQLGVM